jgi:hypothetical protein
MLGAKSFIESVYGMFIRSFKLLIAVLVVCNKDTMMAEYDVVRNNDNIRRERSIILDDMPCGSRVEPAKE